MAANPVAELLAELRADRMLAHKLLFKSRHPNTTPAFHRLILDAWASPDPRVLIKAFRGAAKSTIAEEFLILETLFGDEPFALIVGNSYEAACSRLASIKNELDYNPHIETMLGGVRGDTWTENKIVLSNGCQIRAYGRGQSLRGAKEEKTNKRPTLVLVDDLEDVESVGTPEARNKTWNWLMRELLPALDPKARVRVNGTPLHEDSIVERLAASSEWHTLEFPIVTGYADSPDAVPTWPDRFPLPIVQEIRQRYAESGDLAGFSQEYLCKPIDNAARTFSKGDISVTDNFPEWAPRILVVDPARTTKATSSRTGYAVFSWLGSQLYVHDAIGAYDTPFEQVGRIFELAEAHKPMLVAVEANGLEEWLMQPLRAEMARRGDVLPLQAIRAPKDKKQFIAGLEPFFRAREVFFTKPLPDLEMELLSFPVGKLDVVNALAYALRVRPGAPVYTGFKAHHIKHFAPSARRATAWLALNAGHGSIAAVLVMVQDGAMHVVRDWVREGDTATVLQALSMDIAQWSVGGNRPQIIIPQERAQTYDGTALGEALRRLRITFDTGPRTVESVESLTNALRNDTLTVSPEATWTLNALAGGYARAVDKDVLHTQPQDNIHKVVAQALEVLGKRLEFEGGFNMLAEEGELYNAQTRSGRSYISMLR